MDVSSIQLGNTNTTLGIGYQRPHSEIKNRAQLVSPHQVLVNNLKSIQNLPQNIHNGISEQKLNDYQLARLDDAAKFLSVFGVAALMASSPNVIGSKIVYWLGGAGWLTAMAVYPKFLKTMVKTKTNVPLDTHYKSSEGEIKPLFDDPDYMPLQVLPKKKYSNLAHQFHIPDGAISKDERLQAKLKQISVQTHTWWMLTAGLATPLITSLFCDLLEKPIQNFVTHQVKANIIHARLDKAIKSRNRPQIIQQLRKWVSLNVSQKESSKISLWWQQWTDGLLKQLHLDDPKILRQLQVNTPNKTSVFFGLQHYLCDRFGSLSNREALESYLNRQQQEVKKIIEPVIGLLRSPRLKGLVSADDINKLTQEVKLARGRSLGTINHLLAMIETYEKHQGQSKSILRSYLKAAMEKPNLSYLVQCLKEGRFTRVEEMAGPYFERVMRLMANNHYLGAHDVMGELPKDLLLRAMNSKAQRLDWIKWFPKRFGLGLLTASALFTYLCVGKDFNKPLAPINPTDGGSK